LDTPSYLTYPSPITVNALWI